MASTESGDGSVINIIKITRKDNEPDEIKLDEEALAEVFQHKDVANLPIVLYSVVGPYRSGKSFLLNLFLRFMKLRTHPTDDLQPNPQEELESTFAYRGGIIKGCTEGIFLLKTPYITTTCDGQKVAVFIMDTQGMFDFDSSAKNMSTVVGFSFLISSFQFYNCKGVNKQSFDTIHQFANFASEVKQSQNTSPFQSLMLLVRDWKSKDFTPGLEGGRRYFDELLEERSKANKNIRHSLMQSFDKIECFLFPPPGDTVEAMGKEDTTCLIKDIAPAFLNKCDEFFEHLCDPNNLILKKIDNEVVTCSDLFEYAKEYARIIENEEVAPIEGFIEGGKKAKVKIAIRECEKAYKQEMKKMLLEHPEQSNVQNIHEESKIKAYTLFCQKTEERGEEMIEDGKRKLDRLITLCYENILDKRKMNEITNFCFSCYRDNMMNWEGGEDELQKEHDLQKAEASKRFQEDKKPENDQLLKKYQQKLDTEIQAFYEAMQTRVRAQVVLRETVGEFSEALNQGIQLQPYQAVNSKAKLAAINQLMKIKKSLPHHIFKKYCNDFKKQAKTVYTSVKRANWRNRNILGAIAGTFGLAALVAGAVVAPLLPAIIAAEVSTAGIISSTITGAATAGGVTGGVTSVATNDDTESKYNVKVAALAVGLLGRDILFSESDFSDVDDPSLFLFNDNLDETFD
ncbi:unnamed protein product [Clavelina lepadiformis]|uniref:GB1/RHD3-type G domain-containing protein n=1 Tax=Clavelina lepadiformis TaxID=159417 RepID=A0ABP0GB48_CLALP